LEDYAEQGENEKGCNHSEGDVEQRLLKTSARLVHPAFAAKHAAQAATLTLQNHQRNKRNRQDDLYNVQILSQLRNPSLDGKVPPL